MTFDNDHSIQFDKISRSKLNEAVVTAFDASWILTNDKTRDGKIGVSLHSESVEWMK